MGFERYGMDLRGYLPNFGFSLFHPLLSQFPMELNKPHTMEAAGCHLSRAPRSWKILWPYIGKFPQISLFSKNVQQFSYNSANFGPITSIFPKLSICMGRLSWKHFFYIFLCGPVGAGPKLSLGKKFEVIDPKLAELYTGCFAVNSSILVRFCSSTNWSLQKINQLMRNRMRYQPQPGRICESQKTQLS